ncbi:UPF0688 protein C1orf174 homolog isoform X2 [Dunckerocampus dactyliophorus]|uniref:UPF0688 protein C1orf174 homolog isoform X2 n=1 Tax=Dunckerocampus dactyliophorus TaxID=161453 RepID=UPI0024069A0F|nr:UPF0688 protein C1orf174 homolog isoform X2 [Dunckerocampus dactyliophorus]XP_054645716.1 UPF0688 protein C1orf174 homolog isoform X2 [Dunckerocampus dactyliophorus]
MIRKMSGQLNNLKHRKRKNISEPKHSKKSQGSVTRRKCMKSPKALFSAERSSAASPNSSAVGDTERLSHISCECLQSAGRRRCSASPLLDGQEGKENELRMSPILDTCTWYGIRDKHGLDDMDCEELDKNMFPDDDSNQILPVEQFFGNLDALQDFPQRTSETSHHQSKHRRRHYYAREDSDEEQQHHEAEEGLSSTQQEDRVGTL